MNEGVFLNNKEDLEELDMNLNMIECIICHKSLPKEDFNKIPGSDEYSKVCINCEEKVLLANNLNDILKFLNPNQELDKEKLIEELPDIDLPNLILNLNENSLIKKDSESHYFLESVDVLNNYLNKYLKEFPRFKKTKEVINKRNSLHGDVEYDKNNKKWCPYVYKDDQNKKFYLSLCDSEKEAKENLFKYLNEGQNQSNNEEDDHIPKENTSNSTNIDLSDKFDENIPNINSSENDNTSDKENKFNGNNIKEDNNTQKDIKDNLSRMECIVCHKCLPKENFIEFNSLSNVCKDCKENVLVANYLNKILEFLSPDQEFDKDKLIQEHPGINLADAISSLEEKNLIKKDYESQCILESANILNDYLDKYFQKLPEFDKKFNHSFYDYKKTNDTIKEKSEQNKFNSGEENFKCVIQNTKTLKWNPYIYKADGNFSIGDYDSEMDAYNARFKYLQNIKKNIEEPEINSNNQYSYHEGVSFDKHYKVWNSYINLNKGKKKYKKSIKKYKKSNNRSNKDLGYFNSEEEAFQARIGYLTENKDLFKDPRLQSNRRFTNDEGVSYNRAYHKWYSYILEKDKQMDIIGFFDSKEEAINARLDKLNEKNTDSSEEYSINNNLKGNKTEEKFSKIDNNEIYGVNFFVNNLGKDKEILAKGLLSVDEAFNSLNEIKNIKSEINKIILDNTNGKIELFIEIKIKHLNLTEIVSLLKKLGWEQLNIK